MLSVVEVEKVLNPVRVVVVDDSDDIRVLVRLLLEREPDFEVVGEAANGLEGVQAVAAHHPHLVLLDVSMPVMDGLQALTLIREESPGSIVVMLSGFGENTGIAERCRGLGASGYVQKGGPTDGILEQLRVLLHDEFPLPVRP